MKNILLIALILSVTATVSSAASWRVEQDGSGVFTTLQPAVDAAASGDTILVGPGWYQELHWVDHYGSPIQVGAYWTDDKDLFFIGTSASEVKIGPPSYVRYLDGPQGIFQEGLFRNSLYVSNITFVNLYIGTSSFGTIEIVDCDYNTCAFGVVAVQGADCRVEGCTFSDIQGTGNACNFNSCATAEVTNCELGASVYFGSTGNGIIRNCTASGRQLGYYYRSNGLVEDNEATCTIDPCLAANEGSVVEIRRNHLVGGSIGVSIDGLNTHVILEANTIESPEYHNVQIRSGATLEASGNDFIKAHGMDKYLVRCASYPGVSDPITISMENNYWADELSGVWDSLFLIGAFIIDYNDDPNLKILIDFDPFALQSVPVESESWGSIKSMYR